MVWMYVAVFCPENTVTVHCASMQTVMSFCARLFHSGLRSEPDWTRVNKYTRTPGSPAGIANVRNAWQSGMAHRCIHRVHFSAGSDRKEKFIPKSASTKSDTADKFDTFIYQCSAWIIRLCRYWNASGTFSDNYFGLAGIKSRLYPDIDMAASAGTSAEKAVLYKGSQILPFLLSFLLTNLLYQVQNRILCFHFSVFDMFGRTAQAWTY